MQAMGLEGLWSLILANANIIDPNYLQMFF